MPDGVPGCGGAFQPLLADLGWDSYAVDLPGNGCDDTPPEAVNLAAYVDHCTTPPG